MIKLRSEWRSVKIGAKFGRLEVIGVQFRHYGNRKHPDWLVMCRCKCGKFKPINPLSLDRRATNSCGCIRSEYWAKALETHGKSNSKLYRVWRSMVARCHKPKLKAFKWYGARGIQVCDEWKNFEVFNEWAIANGYKPGLQIDRENGNGNYEPGNCRFVTSKTNNNNRRNNRLLTAWGEVKTVSEWADDSRCNVSYFTLFARVCRKTSCGWTPEEAISTPPLQ